MSAFMVDKAHVDLLVRAALEGPAGVDVNPGNAWHGPRWPDCTWDELAEIAETDYVEAGRHLRHVYAYPSQADETSPDQLGLLLVAENLASIHYRYPDTVENHEAVPGPIDQYWTDYHYERPARRLTAVEILKALDCFDYQACEDPRWRSSEAYRFCDALRHAVVRYLPGYDDAPWDWTAERAGAR